MRKQRPTTKTPLATVILATVTIIGPFLNQYYQSLMIFLFIYAVLAMSYDIMGGQMGYMNLGHAIFYGIGAYFFAILLRYANNLVSDFLITLGLIVVSFLATGVLVGIIGFFLSYPLFRLKGFYFAVASLGLINLVNLVISSGDLAPITGGFTGISLPVSISSLSSQLSSYYITLGLLFLAALTYIKVVNSKFGLALATIKEDEEAAEVSGVNVFRYKQLALVVSAIIAGYAGAAYIWFQTHTNPRFVFSLDLAFLPITMSLLGGSGTILGPIIGAIVFSLVYQLLIINLSAFSKLIIGVVLITVGIMAPRGLVGIAQIVINRFYKPR